MKSRFVHTVGIIGYGHMGKAIGKRLKKRGFQIVTSDGEKNIEVAEKSDVLILAVKPFIVSSVVKEIAPHLRKNQLLISIAAGVSLQTIINSLRIQKIPQLFPEIIRVMPNLPAQIGLGMSIWKSATKLSYAKKNLVKSILKAFGEEIEVKSENLIDSATAVSGSGPAYVFAFLDSLSNAANKLGFSQKAADEIALQTVVGASHFAYNILRSSKETRFSFENLVSQVKTKGGTTEAAFKILDKKKWQKILEAAVHNAYKRAKALSR